MEKVRMFVWGDAVVPTGFGRVLHSIIDNLPKDLYDIHWLGVNYRGDPHSYPYKIYPAASKGDSYGFNRMDELLKAVNPQIILALNDPWIIDPFLSGLSNMYGEVLPPTFVYFPCDAKDHNPDWYANFHKVIPVAYSKFGYSVAKAARPDLEYSIIPHGVDTDKFFPVDRDVAIESVFPKDPDKFKDSFIVLNANRNQPRKRLDLTIKGFAEFAKDKPDNVYLYMHSGTVDSGIDTLFLAKRLGIEKRICISSRESGPQRVTTEKLNHIYNVSDVGINTSLGEGWGLCVEENEPVWTLNGIKHIKDVVKGDEVVSHTGQARKVKNVFDNGMKNVVKVDVLNRRGLLTTPEHQIMTIDGWKQVKDLVKYDLLEVTKPDLDEDDIILDLAKDTRFFCDDERVWYKGTKAGTMKRFVSINKDLNEAIGSYLSRGRYTPIFGGKISFIVMNEKKALETMRNLEGLGIACKLVYDTRFNQSLISFTDPYWVDYFKNNFGTGGHRGRRNLVPREFFNHNLYPVAKAYIDSRMKSTDRKAFFYTFSDQVASFIAYQMVANNITVSVKVRASKNGRYTEFTVSGSSMRLFRNKTAIDGRDSLTLLDGKYYATFWQLVEQGPMHVYDLEVEEDHSYTLDGLIVHNCNVEHAVTGKPQIVPDHSTCRELFHDCGILTKIDQEITLNEITTEGGLVRPDDVAAGIQYLYDNPAERARLGKAGYDKFKDERLSWKYISGIWNKFFQGVLDGNNVG